MLSGCAPNIYLHRSAACTPVLSRITIGSHIMHDAFASHSAPGPTSIYRRSRLTTVSGYRAFTDLPRHDVRIAVPLRPDALPLPVRDPDALEPASYPSLVLAIMAIFHLCHSTTGLTLVLRANPGLDGMHLPPRGRHRSNPDLRNPRGIRIVAILQLQNISYSCGVNPNKWHTIANTASAATLG